MLLARDPGMGIQGDRIGWMQAGVIGGEERPEPLTRTTVTTEVVGTGHGDG